MQDAVRKIPHKIIFIESVRDMQRDKSSILYLKSIFDRKPVTSKSKGEIITPKNKMELQKLVKLKKQYLGDIDISNIKDLSFLFEDVDRNDFAGIENWDTSHIEDMRFLFCRCKDFNHDIGMWNTSKVKNMESMFEETSFNHNIGAWDTSKVESMRGMFQYQYNNSFNQNINTWNTGKVKDMSGMFCAAKAFNQPLDKWDTSKVATMQDMFRYSN